MPPAAPLPITITGYTFCGSTICMAGPSATRMI